MPGANAIQGHSACLLQSLRPVAKKSEYVKVEGEILKLSNLDRILYPSVSFTKGDLIRYYLQAGPFLIPHLRGRLFTFRRFPEGVEAASFFEKNCPPYRPKSVATARFDRTEYCLIGNLASLVWVANLASIELHTTFGSLKDFERPTAVVFDLDPGPGAGFQECAEIALLIRELLRKLSLRVYPKTSGGKGLHLYVPLNTPADFEGTLQLAKSVAISLESRFPDRVTSRMPKKFRFGKVFIDWSQNVRFKSTVSVYSLRAGPVPTVSTPLRWSEVKAASSLRSRAETFPLLGPEQVLKRTEKWGDIFAPVLELRQPLVRDLNLRTSWRVTRRKKHI